MLPEPLRVAPALRDLYRGKADPCSAGGTSGTGPLLPPAPFPCPCHSWIIQRKASLCSMACGISTAVQRLSAISTRVPTSVFSN